MIAALSPSRRSDIKTMDDSRTKRLQLVAGIVLGTSLIATGLIAGVYYAFTCGVMLGLAQADDRTFIVTMQRINVAIVNPLFAFSFFGAFVFPVIAAVLQRRLGKREAARSILAAAVLYGLALAVTAMGNIPLNEELVRAGDPAHITDLAAVRHRFEQPWIFWNIVRGLLSTAALGCLGHALVLHGKAV